MQPQNPKHQPPQRSSKKKKLTLYFSLVIATIALVIGVNVAIAGDEFSTYPDAPPTAEERSTKERETMSVEELGMTCQVPNATDLVLVTSAESETSLYQVWRMMIDGQEIERTTTLFGTVCGLSNDSRFMSTPYENVPENIARELAVGSLRYNIQLLGGVEEYERSLMNRLQDEELSSEGIPQFSSIDVAAWEVLGLEIPSDLYEVIEFKETEPYAN
jgi:hypothetical protein